jgi:hypothetical protein
VKHALFRNETNITMQPEPDVEKACGGGTMTKCGVMVGERARTGEEVSGAKKVPQFLRIFYLFHAQSLFEIK